MQGTVDSQGRALLTVDLRNPFSRAHTTVEVWVDTGFTGPLVLPVDVVTGLGLLHAGFATGETADGNRSQFSTFYCEVKWMGSWLQLEALEGQGKHALVGVPLLDHHVLTVDYQNNVVELT